MRKTDIINETNLTALRPLFAETDIIDNAQGSVLFSMGKTKVICSATLTEDIPSFLYGTGRGWLTAEYAMLSASTLIRKKRETIKADGRSTEIKRLIGRALRSVCNFDNMGEKTFYIDCDVLNADGGTRTASVNGAFLALALCADRAVKAGILDHNPINSYIGAVSVGIVDDKLAVDLCYEQDRNAAADMNVIVTQNGGICEIQISAEKRPVKPAEFSDLLELANNSITKIIKFQQQILTQRGIEI